MTWREADEGLPLLAVDVDGVVILLGGDDEGAADTVRLELIDGMAHRVSIVAGECLRRLSDHFELVWATGWQERANDYFPELLGLPRLSREGMSVAWVDDTFDDNCFEWAAAREAPTLLVSVDPRRGLRVKALSTWTRPFAPFPRG